MTRRGQGKNQQAVLSCLARHPSGCTARQISEETGVPYTGAYGAVYRILHDLQREGLVSMMGHNPSIWVATIADYLFGPENSNKQVETIARHLIVGRGHDDE